MFIGISATTKDPKTLIIYDGVTLTKNSGDDKNLTTKVDLGDYVAFIPFGDIVDIISIEYEAGGQIFKKEPRRHRSGIWIGKIKNSLRKDEQPESYTISYIVKGHDKIFKQDPKITIDF